MKWYLGFINRSVENISDIKNKITSFKKRISEGKYEWIAYTTQSLDNSLLKSTYYTHREVTYQTWVYVDSLNQLQPRIERYLASLGLSFIIKKGENLIILYPHKFNDIPMRIRDIREYVMKISSLIFEDPSSIQILKYDVSSLNSRYNDNLKGMGFASRLGGVKSGIIYGDHMEGDAIFEEAKKGEERYSIFNFPILNREFKVGISATGAIVTFNNIDGFEFEFFKNLYSYLKVSREFY